ncbi:MAG: anthranilate phosphoribosyltransferase [Proteobacteria bacterium]|nr:anthranilate phosphoribosyltransferase [Pseudomonadota bacterium]
MSAALKPLIAKAADRALTRAEAEVAFAIIMSGEATMAQIGGLLMALRTRGEAISEITGAAAAMRAKSAKVKAPKGTMDIVGTGGDGKDILNISSATAFVVAGAGVPVAKHGNRAQTSKSGAADAMTQLGINVMVPAEVAERALAQCGICFMMAPMHHAAMKHVMPARLELGTRTVFNILGPLTNPAGATCHVMGAPNVELAEKLAHVLSHLGMRHALVVTGDDGLDDITVTGPTQAFEVRGIEVTRRTITPFDLGLTIHPAEALTGGDAEQNAALTRSVLTGNGPLALRDLVVAQAAAGLYVTGLAASLRQGAEMAIRSIDDGDAAAKLAAFVEATRRAAGK